MNKNEETRVRVAVRVRPMSDKEKLEKWNACVTVDNSINQVNISKKRGFRFDYAFDQNISQNLIFDTCVKNLVDGFFEGYNATVFAYGQTGSGKTYTMGTTNGANIDESETGVIPRVIKYMFQKLETTKEKSTIILRASFLEIYNENIKDLLNPSNGSKSLVIREDDKKGITVVGIKEEIVTNFDDMMRCLETGTVYRTTGSTLMNEYSSRSHSIFTIIMEQSMNVIDESENEQKYISAKFHLVDLAGSERNKRTGAVGIRFKESVQINCGLLALGNVISALGDEKKKSQNVHVPYRESKLTRLLQDSLGGNSNTLMIACVSPADLNFEETLNTLKYAHRARNIKNKPVVNCDPHAAQLAELQNQIQTLQLELLKHKLEKSENGSLEELLKDDENRRYLDELHKKKSVSLPHEDVSELQEQNSTLKSECQNLKLEINRAQNLATELSEEVEKVRREKTKNEKRMEKIVTKFTKISENIRHIITTSNLSENHRHLFGKIADKIDELIKKGSDVLQKSTNTSTSGDSKHPSPSRFSGSDRRSFPDHMLTSIIESNGTGFSDVHVKVARLQEELQIAKETISQDEKILHNKIIDIQKLKRNQDRLKRENEALRQKLDEEAKKTVQLNEFIEQLETEGKVSREIDSNQQCEISKSIAGDVSSSSPFNVSPFALEDLSLMEEDLKKMEEEKSKILSEKEAIEEEKLRLEKIAQEQQQNFVKNQKKMEKSLKELTVMIRLKEELIRDLVKSEHESQVIKQQYEHRILEMEEEMSQKKNEMEKLMKNLEEADMDKAKKEQEKQRIRKEYEAQLKKKEFELAEFKRKQQDSQKLIKLKYQSDRRVKELESEISKMQSQQEFLKRKIKEETEKQYEKHMSNSKQIALLKRDSDLNMKKIRELESENMRQKMVLQKKAEEIKKAQHMLKMSKIPLQSSIKRNNAEIDRQKAWLDREIEKYLKKKEAMERLEKELHRREMIIKEKEVMGNRKQEFEMKRMRSSQVISQNILSLSQQIQTLESEIKEKETSISSKNQIENEDGTMKDIREQLKVLCEKKERATRQKQKLEEKALKKQNKEDELLRELDERTEVLEAEIEYKNEAIEKARREIDEHDCGTDDASSMNHIVEKISTLSDARTLLKKYFEKVIELKESEKEKDAKIQQYQVYLRERDKIIENLQNNIRLTELVYERRLTKQQKETELKIQYLLKQVNSSTSSKSLSSADHKSLTNNNNNSSSSSSIKQS